MHPKQQGSAEKRGEVVSRVNALIRSLRFSAFESMLSDEAEWLADNPPDACYADAWDAYRSFIFEARAANLAVLANVNEAYDEGHTETDPDPVRGLENAIAMAKPVEFLAKLTSEIDRVSCRP